MEKVRVAISKFPKDFFFFFFFFFFLFLILPTLTFNLN